MYFEERSLSRSNLELPDFNKTVEKVHSSAKSNQPKPDEKLLVQKKTLAMADLEKLVLFFKGFSIFFTVLGFSLVLFSAINMAMKNNSVCDRISKAKAAGKELSTVASPVQINSCGLKHCTFDLAQCSSDCPLGYLTDQYQCPTSCFCYGEGVMQGDIEFKAQDVPYLTQLFSDNSTFGLIDPLVLFDGISHESYLHSTWRSKGPRHTIPYTFGTKISSSTKQVIKKVFGSLSVQVCIDFVERKSEEDYIKFIDGEMCSSRLGKTKWENTVTINNKSCIGEPAIMHLIMHALGMHHQQTRLDRDSFINIVEANVLAGYKKQFSKMREDLYLNLGVDYNTESLMHFVNNVYSSDGSPTITGKNNLKIRGKTPESLNKGLQKSDILALKSLYKCEGIKSKANSAEWSEWETYINNDFECRKYRICRGKGKRSLSIYCEPDPHISWYQETDGLKCDGNSDLNAQGRSVVSNKVSLLILTHPKLYSKSNMFVESITKISRYICAGGMLFKAAFNDDGIDDFLCVYQDGYAQIYMARQSGVYISPEWEGQTSLCKYGGDPESRFVVGDFDGDGLTDLMCHTAEEVTVTLFTGSGLDGGIDWKGTFPDCNGKVLHAIDLNGDYKDDIVCGNEKRNPYHNEFVFMNTFALSK